MDNQGFTGVRDDYRYGKFKLTTKPSGCTVYLNNSKLSTNTPIPITELPVGKYNLLIEKPNYTPVKKTINIESNGLNEMFFSLKKIVPFAGVEITSNPSSATVEIDNRMLGRTPFKTTELNAGRHNLILSLEGFQSVDVILDLTKGKWNKIHYDVQEVRQPEGFSKRNTIFLPK